MRQVGCVQATFVQRQGLRCDIQNRAMFLCLGYGFGGAVAGLDVMPAGCVLSLWLLCSSSKQ